MIKEGLELEAREADGKMIVVSSPATEGWRIWFAGAGDDLNPTPPASGRGDGAKLRLSFAGADSKLIKINFSEPIELHDGQLVYTPVENWTLDDRWNFFVRIPGNAPSENLSRTGNCNLYPQEAGYNVILPANGDGDYDLDLGSAIPVPSDAKNGFWEVEPETGKVSASSNPGAAGWHLLDLSIDNYFLKNMPMGHPLGVFDTDVYKTEYFHPKWILILSVTKVSEGPGEVGGWVLCFRKNIM